MLIDFCIGASYRVRKVFLTKYVFQAYEQRDKAVRERIEEEMENARLKDVIQGLHKEVDNVRKQEGIYFLNKLFWVKTRGLRFDSSLLFFIIDCTLQVSIHLCLANKEVGLGLYQGGENVQSDKIYLVILIF
jgi:hypothetical protein